ncbi:hypothetical protein BIW11_11464 [Tropilaelaps mercedesae]|uniref:Uncharacterized protein n=1 Tax=Tropilaelaps mercedesae TaxID=418985 RepID=A0A1V9XBG0_9ACAR|nr:hypothetical protein BIW11_11464 [Tropilaelaps mercedesae]
MVYSIYLVSYAAQGEPQVLHSRAFCRHLPLPQLPLDKLCKFSPHGVDTLTEKQDKEQQLLRVFEGNDCLDYILREGKAEFQGALAQSSKKETKKRDFLNGTFRLKGSHLLIHWIATLRGTALLAIAAPSDSPSVIRANLRFVMSSLANRIRLDQTQEVLLKAHIISLTIKYYMPCGQLLPQPPGIQKQVEDAVGKLLK